MNLRPLGPLAAPHPVTAGAGRPEATSEPQDLVEQLRNQGIEFSARRKMGPLSFGLKKLGLEDVARQIGQGTIQMMLPGHVALPLDNLEGLHALAVFHGGLSPETLPQKDLASSLQQLAREGWRFHNQEGEIGAYGAFNFLGKQPVELRRGDVKLEMTYAETAQHMARFYREDSLARRLEGEGYQFFTPSNVPQSAFQANKTSWIGKDGERWIPVTLNDEEKQRDSLQRFARMRESFAGSREQASSAWQAVEAAESPGAGVATWLLKEPGAIQAGVGLLGSPAQVSQFAQSYPNFHPEVFQAAAERLKAFDESRSGAEFTLALQGAQPQQSLLWPLLTGPESSPAQLAADFLQLPEGPPTESVLAALKNHLDVSAHEQALGEIPAPRRKELMASVLREGPDALAAAVGETHESPGLARAYMHFFEGDRANLTRFALEDASKFSAHKFIQAFREKQDPAELSLALLQASSVGQVPRLLPRITELLSSQPETRTLGRALRDFTASPEGAPPPGGADLLAVALLESARLSEAERNQKLLNVSGVEPSLMRRVVDRELARLGSDPELKASIEMVRGASQAGADRFASALGLAVARSAPRSDLERGRVLSNVLSNLSRPTVGEMQAAWSGMGCIPSLQERAEAGRDLCSSLQDGDLERNVQAALMFDITRPPEDVALDALNFALTLQRNSNAPPPPLLVGFTPMRWMNGLQEQRAQELAEVLKLAISRRANSGKTIEEQGRRVVVGGTFIRKRS